MACTKPLLPALSFACSSSPKVTAGCASIQGEKYYYTVTVSSSLQLLKNAFNSEHTFSKCTIGNDFSVISSCEINPSLQGRKVGYWFLLLLCQHPLAAIHRPITVGYLELSWFIPIDFNWMELASSQGLRLNWFVHQAALCSKNQHGSCQRGQLVSGHFPAGFAAWMLRSVCKQLLFASEKYGSLGLGLSQACRALDREHKVRWHQQQRPLLAPLLRWRYNLALFPGFQRQGRFLSVWSLICGMSSFNTLGKTAVKFSCFASPTALAGLSVNGVFLVLFFSFSSCLMPSLITDSIWLLCQEDHPSQTCLLMPTIANSALHHGLLCSGCIDPKWILIQDPDLPRTQVKP